MTAASLDKGLHLHFDPCSGVAGDMTVAALVDAGVPEKVVRDAVRSMGLPGLKLTFERRKRGAFVGLGLTVDWPGKVKRQARKQHAHQHDHHHDVGDHHLTTDLPASALQGRTDVLVRLRGAEVDGIVDSYGHKQPGDLIALIDSEDCLEVAVVNGSAAHQLGARVGDAVEVVYR